MDDDDDDNDEEDDADKNDEDDEEDEPVLDEKSGLCVSPDNMAGNATRHPQLRRAYNIYLYIFILYISIYATIHHQLRRADGEVFHKVTSFSDCDDIRVSSNLDSIPLR